VASLAPPKALPPPRRARHRRRTNRTFFRHALAVRGAVTGAVVPRVLAFVLWAIVVGLIHHRIPSIGIEVGPVEIAGGALALLLVLRTNAGYERWWEARKLWGGIVNQCRNLAATAIAQGPKTPEFRRAIAHWTVAFAHAARRNLRGEVRAPELEPLLGAETTREVERSVHMPGHVALAISTILRDAADRGALDRRAYQIADQQRVLLIDHVGGCERILKTPLPLIYAIKIRRFILLYLAALPFALVDRVGDAIAPVLVALVAYPILGIDQIAVELENPFPASNLGHLPLDDICATIQRTVLGLLESAERLDAHEALSTLSSDSCEGDSCEGDSCEGDSCEGEPEVGTSVTRASAAAAANADETVNATSGRRV
jgi:putative membrane protein